MTYCKHKWAAISKSEETGKTCYKCRKCGQMMFGKDYSDKTGKDAEK